MILNVLQSTDEQEIIDANNQIAANAGMENWSKISSYENVFYIIAPNENGWGGFSQEQLMQNISLEISELEIPNEEF